MTQCDAAIGLRNVACRYVIHQYRVADPGKHSFASVEVKRRVTTLEHMRSRKGALYNGDCIGLKKREHSGPKPDVGRYQYRVKRDNARKKVRPA